MIEALPRRWRAGGESRVGRRAFGGALSDAVDVGRRDARSELAVLARQDEVEGLLVALLEVDDELEAVGEHRSQHRDAIVGGRARQRRRRRDVRVLGSRPVGQPGDVERNRRRIGARDQRRHGHADHPQAAVRTLDRRSARPGALIPLDRHHLIGRPGGRLGGDPNVAAASSGSIVSRVRIESPVLTSNF